MAWEKIGDVAKRAATRLRADNDNDDDTPPAGGGGTALQGRSHEFRSDRDDRSEQRHDTACPAVVDWTDADGSRPPLRRSVRCASG